MKALLPVLVLAIFAHSSIVNGQRIQNSYKAQIKKGDPIAIRGYQDRLKEVSTQDDGLIHLKWQPLLKDRFTEELIIYSLYFQGAKYEGLSVELPIYTKRIEVPSGNSIITAQLSQENYEEITSVDASMLRDLSQVGEQIEITTAIKWHRKRPHGVVSFMPIRVNPTSGKYEKLVSFKLTTSFSPGVQAKHGGFKTSSWAANSVLATGTWYKISVNQTGVHRINYQTLIGMGIDVGAINPQNIRIYGNGGGMLPKKNSDFRHDDLVENAIQIVGELDGSFDGADYILFYGESPNKWTYNSTDGRFHHQPHDFSKNTYYFLTTDGGSGIPKRINLQPSTSGENVTVTSFDDFLYHEQDLVNLIKSGKEWFGENFDILPSYSFPFSFPNWVSSSPIYLKASLVGRAVLPVTGFSFNISAPNLNLNLTGGNVGNGDYLKSFGFIDTEETTFSPNSSSFTIKVTNSNAGATGWLDYLELNARRALKMSGNQMPFRDIASTAAGNVAKYIIANSTSSIQVWDVTDPTTVTLQESFFSGSTTEFTIGADSLKEFIAFNGNTYYTPKFVAEISNQNIHGTIGQPEYVIVTHADFLVEANELAYFHSSRDGMDVAVVQIHQLYNEFSSGAEDVSAIKELMRMLYKRAVDPADMPKYLLLFGDGSYDHKGRLPINTNFIPTYQSANSIHPVYSYVSDDFFGLLDDTEGESANDPVDIGIGRIPVTSKAQAQIILAKIKHYHEPVTMGSWRNVLCFIADDEDGNIHLNDADGIASSLAIAYNDYDIDKIYMDAYNQESTPGGQRYPDVTAAINKRVQSGALIITYTGHGGELGWAHERVLENSDINSWNNYDNLPLFLTATCEFSRFDDPERTAAGEYVFLNSNGGAIAMFTTVRLVTSGANKTLTTDFYKHVFNPINNEMPRLGDVYRLSKNESNLGINSRKFVLLGDPAMRLAYPVHIVLTDSINHQAIAGTSDTLRALAKVTISGHIEHINGGKFTNFNGTVYPTVYDKAVTITTQGNDPESNVTTFDLQKNALFRGKASVVNGNFEFSFVVPKDIAYQPGRGKISYYAENGITDANGPYEDFIIGGTSSNIEIDLTGPQVRLFLNDTNFVDGGLTDENPILLAYIYDEHGINTTGNGIGHDIVAVLDGKTDNPIVLNDDYEADRDNYKSGSVTYPFSRLADGPHSLSLKVWDVYNNSTQVITDFVVAKSAQLALSHVLNYPNPFTTYTEFWFEHNKPGEQLQVQIQVFTISGRLIKTINTDIITQGYRPDPGQWPDLQWDGKDDFGDNIGRGVYVYNLQVRSASGDYANQYEKLVILN